MKYNKVHSWKYILDTATAADEIKNICKQRARKIYGTDLPDIVEMRLLEEHRCLTDFGFISHFYIAKEVTEASVRSGYPIIVDGQIGAFLTAFLLGITEINPLPQHYYCCKCNYFEEAKISNEKQYWTVAFDLEKKKCPLCGAELKGAGANIPFEISAGYRKNREPQFTFHAAPEAQNVIYKRLIDLLGEKYVMQSYLNNSATVKETTVIDPSDLDNLPCCNEARYVTAMYNTSKNQKTCSLYNSQNNLDFLYMTFDIISDAILKKMSRLQAETGICYDSIPMTDEKTLSLFLNSETDGIPVFESNYAKHLLAVSKESVGGDLSFSVLMKILSLSNDIGIWSDYIEREEKLSKKKYGDIICYSDEVWHFFVDNGIHPEKAEYLTKKVRMGNIDRYTSNHRTVRDVLSDIIDNNYINSLENISYLPAKAKILTDMIKCWKIAYYKAHYSKQFEEC